MFRKSESSRFRMILFRTYGSSDCFEGVVKIRTFKFNRNLKMRISRVSTHSEKSGCRIVGNLIHLQNKRTPRAPRPGISFHIEKKRPSWRLPPPVGHHRKGAFLDPSGWAGGIHRRCRSDPSSVNMVREAIASKTLPPLSFHSANNVL